MKKWEMEECEREEGIRVLKEIKDACEEAIKRSTAVASLWDKNNALEVLSNCPSEIKQEIESIVFETPIGFECKEEKEFLMRNGRAIESAREIAGLCRSFLERHRALISLGELLRNLGPICEFGSIWDIRLLQVTTGGIIGTIWTQQVKICGEIESNAKALQDLVKLEKEFLDRFNEQGELVVESFPGGEISCH